MGIRYTHSHLPLLLHLISPSPPLASLLDPFSIILTLILPRSRLTRLQLIQIPPTNRQTTLILIHAGTEIVHIDGTRAAACCLGRGTVVVLVLGGEIGALW